MNDSWVRTDSTSVYKDPWIRLDIDYLQMANGQQIQRHIVRTKNGAGTVAITENREICLVIQYRYPIGAYSLEIPKGAFDVFDSTETPIEVAQRELREETGITAEAWGQLGLVHTVTGISNDCVHLFWATKLTFGLNAPDEMEDLCMVRLSVDETLKAISEGIVIEGIRYTMTDATSISAIFMATRMSSLW